jgi:NTE family protein
MYGLVLEGGGGKGAYQVGACKALDYIGVNFAAVAGTSVGALNGAMIVQGDLEKAYELWYDIDPSKVIKLTDQELKELSIGGLRGTRLNTRIKHLKKIIMDKGLDIEPLIHLVTNFVDEEKIRNSGIDFGIVTFDLTYRKPVEIYLEDIPHGKLADYLIASASFPGFKLKEIDGRVFMDGGICNSLPINLVAEKGYKDVIVIRTFSFGRERRINTEGLNLTYITPSESLGAMLDFSSQHSRRNLKMGYFDTLKVFNKLKGKLYYINSHEDDDFFIKYLMNLEDDKIERIGKLIGIEQSRGKRLLFEYIIPKISDIMGISQKASYEDISIAMIENTAQAHGIERFKVYSLEELFSEIAPKLDAEKSHSFRYLPGFWREGNLMPRFAKEKLLLNIASELFGDIIKKKAAY